MKKSFAYQAALKKKSGATKAESDDSAMLERIMSKRKMSEGGVVSNSTEVVADELPNEFDDLALDDNLEAHYPEDMSARIARQRKLKQSA